MGKSLNFNSIKKTYLTVTLADENNTTLLITTPTKAVMDDLVSIQESLTTVSDDETSLEATDNLYAVCAKLMSRNKAGIKITKDKLSEIFDFEDIIVFFDAYMEFIGEVTSAKN